MDNGVGRVLETLKKQGLDENTIVIFTSDNGPWFEGSTGGLRGGKGQPFEGAFKVPLIVSWKNHIQPNTTSSLRVRYAEDIHTLPRKVLAEKMIAMAGGADKMME
ncbi:hypothetical protein B566_EDAN019380, partial [Ephemera danica]